jgi:roadblock/LC7 domain-containing protein
MSILASLVGPVTGLLDKFIEDKDTKNALAHEIATMSEKHAMEVAKGQLAVNAVEAAHKSLFVAGWRPFVGWISGIGLLYNVLIAQVLGIWFKVPEVDPSLLTPILMGMLGMGAMRSYEKTKNVAREK